VRGEDRPDRLEHALGLRRHASSSHKLAVVSDRDLARDDE
jgi:hypothetical protein